MHLVYRQLVVVMVERQLLQALVVVLEVVVLVVLVVLEHQAKEMMVVLDQVVEVTGWSRDNARRRLTAAARPPGAGREVAKRSRRQRNPKYSYDALKVLQKVWAASGGYCGRYLVASMALQLDALERHGELVPDQDRYSADVRAELLAMSSATIDRYLRGAKARDQIKGKSTTKPSLLLRSSTQ